MLEVTSLISDRRLECVNNVDWSIRRRSVSYGDKWVFNEGGNSGAVTDGRTDVHPSMSLLLRLIISCYSFVKSRALVLFDRQTNQLSTETAARLSPGRCVPCSFYSIFLFTIFMIASCSLESYLGICYTLFVIFRGVWRG